MTTPLSKPVAREVLLDREPFKVVMEQAGVRINRKGRRKGPVVGWDTILTLLERREEPRSPIEATAVDLPNAVAGEVAAEILSAKEALENAVRKLDALADLPPSLRAELDPDPVHGRYEQRSDWFIEPLLTATELASILRVSKARVRRLPIPSIELAGERRYRQSQVRRYLEREETHGHGRHQW